DRTNIMVGYRQTNQKTDTGKTLTRWPVFVDHFKAAFLPLWISTASSSEDFNSLKILIISLHLPD
ncbi:hypothetical protein, partial [Enterobacter sp.]|uniref:hypothetical protein n=1 Tax=Enterobacter TaxID=547 RepID=UPI0029063629|nr:hypothetical protein [Enterobacter sp.]